MVDSYGLIDVNGDIINGSSDFTVIEMDGVVAKLKFNRNVQNSVVVATHRRPFCDNSGGDRPIQVGQSPRNTDTICFFMLDGQFSFMLINGS